ncbi:type II secretion system protein GspM [Psychrobacter ciconiae]|uniref:type II secretion system protein GspM n=1 Tax=Psychrobacter ciconiae TaxID=1553449 RepID=UPI001918A458|nr:type II secretion system protein GspM [Psychrobacter ciconiae]
MKFIQRRVRRTAPTSITTEPAVMTTSKRPRYLDAWANQSQEFWQNLAPRDRLALSILMLFFIITIFGYGGYRMHTAAQKSKLDYQNQVADYFWLRGQAANIDSNPQALDDSPLTVQVNNILNSMGVTGAQVVAIGEGVQLSFTHPSQAVVANVLGQLEQQGWQLDRLSINQDTATNNLSVQANLKK